MEWVNELTPTVRMFLQTPRNRIYGQSGHNTYLLLSERRVTMSFSSSRSWANGLAVDVLHWHSRALRYSASLILCVCLLNARTPCSAEEMPQALVDALRSNAAALDPVTIEWSWVRDSALSEEDLESMFGREAARYSCTGKGEVLYSWQRRKTYSKRSDLQRTSNGEIREEDRVEYSRATHRDGEKPQDDLRTPAAANQRHWRPENNSERIVVQESSVDLSNWYNGSPEATAGVEGRKGSAILGITPLAKARVKFPGARITRPDYFLECGFAFPSTPEEHGQSQQSSILLLTEIDHNDNHIKYSHPQENRHVVEVSKKDRTVMMELDETLHYAVVRRLESDSQQSVIKDTTCSHFVRLEGSECWLPREIEVRYHSWRGRPSVPSASPLLKERYLVKDVHRKPIPDTRFELRYEAPGTFISDSRAADGSTTEGRSLEYRVPASPT
ncbi:MAG: hypothetical protein ACK50J_19205, partial [Planctomyces sp.]